MTGKLFWKFSFIIALLAWCYASISPIQDRLFSTYIESQATANLEEFDTLLESGNARVSSSESPTLYCPKRSRSGTRHKFCKIFPRKLI